MGKFYIIILLVPILFCSCNKNKLNDFEKTFKISDYELIYSDKHDALGEILNVEILDSIIIMKHRDDKYYFSFLDINTQQIVKRWGLKGRGPNEYSQLGSGFSIYLNKLSFIDNMRKEMIRIPVLDIIKYSLFFRPRIDVF